MYSPILNAIPRRELVSLWEELLTAYYGLNRYAGNVAEIYFYRLSSDEISFGAPTALVELVEYFCEEHNCSAKIDGMDPYEWLSNPSYVRAHVEITK
jgi:hypothetical protein